MSGSDLHGFSFPLSHYKCNISRTRLKQSALRTHVDTNLSYILYYLAFIIGGRGLQYK